MSRQRSFIASTLTALGLLLAASGCTTSYTIIPQIPNENEKLNESLREENVTIKLANGTETEGTNFWMTADSAQWVNAQLNNTIRVSSESVKSVSVRNSVLGAFKGMAIGLAGGLFLSQVLRNGMTPSSDIQLSHLWPVLSPPLGIIAGLILGADNEHTNYEMSQLPESIRVLTDSVTHNARVRHAIVQLVYAKKDIGVFGTIISDTPVVILRVSRERIWEIPSSLVHGIQPIQPGNIGLSGFRNGWLAIRKDKSTVLGDSLTGYLNGNLEMDYCGSRIVLADDEIKILLHFNNQVFDFSPEGTITMATMTPKQRDATLSNVIQQERKRNTMK